MSVGAETPDPIWDETWLAELDGRIAAAERDDKLGDQWQEVRARIAARLRRLRS